MKKSFIAAVTATVLAAPAAAQGQDPVHACFVDKLDQKIASFEGISKHLSNEFAATSDSSIKLEVAYTNADKENWITACEASTGETATARSRELTSYYRYGSDVTIKFLPQ